MVDLREGLQQKLGPSFTVERELTGGGMSRVFVALDASLGRRVVVKVLPADLAASVSVERFKREILLAATLQHPHIVGVLTAGEIDGMPYFTMPFVEGESLRARIERDGRLQVGRAVSILKDVARALAYAHERGVVHRDIKPDNVLLAGTSATVTDFGIAKALLGSIATDPGAAGREQIAESRERRAESTKSKSTTGITKSGLTQLGTTLGTPAYMAPEQAAADPSTDHRADIYSFGIMAYEMLTGQVPFRNKTPQALLAAQLTATPPPIPARRTDVPAALAKLVMQCLEKEREKRPQSAREIAELLENPEMVSGAFASAPMIAAKRRNFVLAGAIAAVAILAIVGGIVLARGRTVAPTAPASQFAGAAAAERARSIVVLPFVNIGRDSSDDYLADGLTNDIINVLGKVAGLRVTSRSVATSAREKFTSAPEIGKALNVGRILEGTVQREGDRLRVTARVTNTDDGFMIWSDMFERTLKDVFAVQDEISGAIANALGSQIGAVAVANRAESERGTADDVAYDLYLRGRHFFEERGEPALRRAMDLYRSAAQKDPKFARAYAGLAAVYSVLPLYSHDAGDALFKAGFQSATKAIQLDSMLAEAYASRAVLLNGRWRWKEAERDFVHAIALDPKYAAAHQWYGEQLMMQNRPPEAVEHLKRASELDPVSPVIASSYSMALSLARRDPEAISQARRAVELDSALFLPRLVLGLAHLLAKRTPEAIQELEPALGLSNGSPYVQGVLGYAYAVGGQRQNADAMAQQLASKRDPDSQGALAVVQIGLGDTARALSNLEEAARAHAPIFAVQPLGEPLFDPVRGSARFQALLKTLGLQ
jgi:eukaryotic-like serine/threonine-protein kinase